MRPVQAQAAQGAAIGGGFKATLLTAAETVVHWSLWFGRLVVAIGIVYAAARVFSFGMFNFNGVQIPIPRVTAEPIQLAYIAGCICACRVSSCNH